MRVWLVIAALGFSATIVLADSKEDCGNLKGDAGIAACDAAVQQNTADAQSYNFRAVKYFGKGDYDRALADFSRAIEIDRKFAQAYVNRAATYTEKKDYDRAIADYDEWVKLQPDRADALHTRGEWLAGIGKLDLSLRDLNESIKMRPKDAPTLDGRGRTYMLMGQFDKALRDLDAAYRYGKFTNSLYARGWAKIKTGDTKGGNKDMADAKKSNPKIAEYDKYYGIIR